MDVTRQNREGPGPAPDKWARDCWPVSDLIPLDVLCDSVESAGFEHSAHLKKQLEALPVITEQLLDEICIALLADINSGAENGSSDSQYFSLSIKHNLTDLSLLSILPRLHSEDHPALTRYGNYLAVIGAESAGISFLLADQTIPLDSATATYHAAGMMISLSFLARVEESALDSSTHVALSTVADDRIFLANSALDRHVPTTKELEQFYRSLLKSQDFSTSGQGKEILQDLLSSMYRDDNDWDSCFFADSKPQIYLDVLTLEPEADLSEAAIESQRETMEDLRLTHQLRSALDPGNDSAALTTWATAVESIRTMREARMDSSILLATPELRRTQPVAPGEMIAVSSMGNLEDPLGRSNAARLFRSLVSELASTSIDRILLPNEWLMAPRSSEQKFFSAQIDTFVSSRTSSEAEAEVTFFQNVVLEYCKSTAPSFVGFLHRQGYRIDDQIPRGMAHIIETVDFLRDLDVAIEFYQHRKYTGVLDSNTLYISKVQPATSIVNTIVAAEAPAPVIISHTRSSVMDEHAALGTSYNARDTIRSKISFLHRELAEQYGHDATGTVCTQTVPGDAFRAVFSGIAQYRVEMGQVVPADFYVTTVSSDPQKEETFSEPEVPEKVDAPVAG